MDIPDVQINENQPGSAHRIKLKLLTDDRDMLVKAVEKWIKFNQGIWEHVNGRLQTEIRFNGTVSTWLRLSIIVISAAITTMSSIGDIPRLVITLVAGVMTALTGVEAYLKLGDRQSNARKMQREIEHLRDDLRFQWFTEVEVPPNAADYPKRLDAARRLLQEGPEKYNQILDKYAMKAEKGETPGDQGPANG